jgi:hypothetical protein
MKTGSLPLLTSFALLLWMLMQVQDAKASQDGAAIPMSRLGETVQARYEGEGISVVPAPGGALIRSAFQKLEGLATSEGLWITSTEGKAQADRFRVHATKISRNGSDLCLEGTGVATVCGDVVKWTRPMLVEEYRTSVDGIRQDFMVQKKPEGSGLLEVHLNVVGATVDNAKEGVSLKLTSGGRQLRYSRLKVLDARGRELAARLEATAEHRIRVQVDDMAAAYPIRIDPTYSDADWTSMGGWTMSSLNGSGDIFATATDHSGNLYVGGNFTTFNGVQAGGVAVWNGSTWSPLGSGLGGGGVEVLAMVFSGGSLFVGGSFNEAGGNPANKIARWDGTAWHPLGSGITGTSSNISCMAVSGGDLYVGGFFTHAGGVSTANVARWDGVQWHALGHEGSMVSAMTVHSGSLVISIEVNFVTALRRWNGTTWNDLAGWGGTGLNTANGRVHQLASNGTHLYAAGILTVETAGGVRQSAVARWNGSTWELIGSSPPRAFNYITSLLLISDNEIYITGDLDLNGDSNFLAHWDGSTWTGMGSEILSPFFSQIGWISLTKIGPTLFVGGNFGLGGSVARWDGAKWSGIAGAIESADAEGVWDIAIAGNNLYVGGKFVSAGGIYNGDIVRWDGSGWSSLGFIGTVRAICVSGNDLYVGVGDANSSNWTTMDDSASGSGVAKWNGSIWSALGSGVNGVVNALAISGGDLYVGGTFTEAGGTAASRIARWNGTSWSALGAGISDNNEYPVVECLEPAPGGGVYVGGHFTHAGGQQVNSIARWDGTTWNPLGTGFGLSVASPQAFGMAVSGNDLYVGGYFNNAGGVSARNIARWNGSAWNALGGGIGIYDGDSMVNAVAVADGTLFVAGAFNIAGGTAASNIAQWDGSSWLPVGSGIDSGSFGPNVGKISCLKANASHLYVGGFFELAGNKQSVHLARLTLDYSAPEIAIEAFGGSLIPDGGAAAGFGNVLHGSVSSQRMFVIRNLGTADLTGLQVGSGGPDSAQFIIHTQDTEESLPPGGSTTFSVTFSPSGPLTSTRSAVVHVASNDANENPYDILLSGTGFHPTADTDGDGLRDWAESQMASLGFNWQASQPDLVSTFNSGASSSGLYTQGQYDASYGAGRDSVLLAPNNHGLYTLSQVQQLHVGTPLIQKNAGAGSFTLKIGVQKATNLGTGNFTAFPMLAPQCVINAQGQLEFEFTVPDNAAFFKVTAE